MYHWTILPPQFLVLLADTPNYGALSFAIGMKERYPPFWEIDTVTRVSILLLLLLLLLHLSDYI